MPIHQRRTTAFRDLQRPLNLDGGNRSKCPTTAVRGSARDRLSWVESGNSKSARPDRKVVRPSPLLTPGQVFRLLQSGALRIRFAAQLEQFRVQRVHFGLVTAPRTADSAPAIARAGANRPYSITSSAQARSVGGMIIPSAFAVLRLIRSSNLVGCSIGISAGFAPCKIRSTNVAARLKRLGRLGA